MAHYVDGFVIPLPKKNVGDYRRMAQKKNQARRDGIVLYIVFKSRAHRDRVNAKVMKDPRIAKMMGSKPMPFDVKRMLYGGFKTIAEA
jgi:uncharacterized protein YbaA (DUF1428 family)